MCLIKIHKRPKISIFPKTVYKVILKNQEKFISPIRESPIEIGKTYTGQFKTNRTILDTIEESIIEDGFIHSIRSLKEAKEVKTAYIYNSFIVECKIPAFTLYYDGMYEEIASRRLKYIKIIE